MTDGIELLIFNTESVQDWHFSLLSQAESEVDDEEAVLSGVWTREQGVVFLLSDLIKNEYDGMIDDILLKNNFSSLKFLAGFREDLVRCLVRDAFRSIDWHDLAREVIRRRNER